MDKPKLREILEKVYSCEVESDAKDKKRILNQAEAEINAIYSPLSVEEIAEVIQNTIEETVTKDKSIYNEDELFGVLGKIKLVETLAFVFSKLRIKGLHINCYYCHKELTEQGALLFGIPNDKEIIFVTKKHICKECYSKLDVQPHPENGGISKEELTNIIENEFNKFNEIVPEWCSFFEGDTELNVRDLKPNLVKAIMERVSK
jgi:hypothetical protein